MPEFVHDTLTLGEYQQARGVTNTEASTNDHGATPARVCPVCDGAVPDDRRVTCSPRCAEAYHGRKRKRVPSEVKPSVADASVTNGNSSPSRSGLAAAVAALIDELGELEGIDRVSIELDSRVVTISRP